MAGKLTENGYVYPNLQETIAQWEKDLQDIYGNPLFSVEDNENFGNLVKVLAGRENLNDQTLAQVINSLTFNGAEGVFLDEILGLNGIFRESATAGSGFAVVETNEQAIDSTPIVAGTLFSGSNGVQYVVENSAIVSQRVTGYKLDASSIQLGFYVFNITNRVTDATYSQSLNLSSSATQSRINFIQALSDFLETVNVSETNIQISEDGLTLYYGFDEALTLRGLSQTIDMYINTPIGNRYTLVEAVGTTVGFNPLRIGEITSMSILPTGYVSVTNISSFSSGTDVETDAAFIERASNQSDNPRSSTRPAILSGLLANVNGIEKAVLNKTVSEGIVTVEPIIIGGESEDIAKELYRTQPVDNIYAGQIAVVVATLDGTTETIRFTRGSTQQLSIRITYKTKTNTGLFDSEEESIITNLVNLSEEWQLGETIFNSQLMSSVFSGVDPNRFIRLKVEIKRYEDLDSEYTQDNYQAEGSELPDLLAENISFVQEVF